MLSPMDALDDPARSEHLRALITKKAALRCFYLEAYGKYRACLLRCPREGLALELGSGAGFVKEVLPEVITSDALSYSGVDRIVDARAMPFENRTLRAIFLLNVFHHVPDVEAFFREAQRCLMPGGRLLIIDQCRGWISTPILRFAHHEPFDPEAVEWSFPSRGPLSGANGALAWIVFERDRPRFERLFPSLRLVRIEPHSPLRYWLAGGLKAWTLLPGWAFPLATRLDDALLRLSPRLASFVDIELVMT
jgi:SAM-dependent methyltransferase